MLSDSLCDVKTQIAEQAVWYGKMELEDEEYSSEQFEPYLMSALRAYDAVHCSQIACDIGDFDRKPTIDDSEEILWVAYRNFVEDMVMSVAFGIRDCRTPRWTAEEADPPIRDWPNIAFSLDVYTVYRND